MSGFSYKGIDIYDITNGSATKGNRVDGYSFNGFTATYNSEIPLDYGFSDTKGTSTRNSTTARTRELTTSKNPEGTLLITSGSLTTPSGCKHISFVGRAGGGGGGGVSGSAKLNVRAVGETTATSGNGGIGGSGNYVYGYCLPVNKSIINYTIGAGGGAGAGTPSSSNRTTSGNGRVASTLTAGSGKVGNETIINFSNTDYKTGSGGNGGAGGNGAKATFNIPSGFRSSPGNQGAPGNTPLVAHNPSTKDFNYNPLIDYGGGGGSASNGGDGALLIIFLYE